MCAGLREHTIIRQAFFYLLTMKQTRVFLKDELYKYIKGEIPIFKKFQGII